MEDKLKINKVMMSKKLTKKEKLTCILLIGSTRILKLLDERNITIPTK